MLGGSVFGHTLCNGGLPEPAPYTVRKCFLRTCYMRALSPRLYGQSIEELSQPDRLEVRRYGEAVIDP